MRAAKKHMRNNTNNSSAECTGSQAGGGVATQFMDISIKGLPNQDIVQGFPGLPATDPRALGLVTIRPSPRGGALKMKRPLGIKKVNISLVRTDTINLSGNHKELMFLISQQDIFESDPGDEIYGLDLPFVLPIGRSGRVTGSLSIPERFIQTTHSIFVRIKTDQSTQPPVSRFPIYIWRFDTLSTFSRYAQPIVINVSSPDHLVNFQCTVTSSAFGHGDKILAYFHLSPNADYRKSAKVKLLRVSLELVQIVTFTKACANEKDKIPEPRRTRMCKESVEFEELYLTDSTVQDVKVVVPSFPSSANVNRHNVGAANAADVPKEGRTGFTNSCALFELTFGLVFKVRFRHARDIEVEHPITISEFSHGACVEYLKSIVQTAELAQYGSSTMMQRRVLRTSPTLAVQIR